MRFSPYNIHRTRVSDGQGGWTISAAVDAYCFGQFHYAMPDTEFFCGADEDVRIDDVLDIESRYYIVREIMSAHNAPIMKWRIELTDRPQLCPTTTTVPATTTAEATTTSPETTTAEATTTPPVTTTVPQTTTAPQTTTSTTTLFDIGEEVTTTDEATTTAGNP